MIKNCFADTNYENFLKGSNSKFVVNLFKTFGIACSLVAVQACNENPNNSDKNGERGGASGGSDNGRKNGGEQPGDEDMDEHDTDTADEEGTGSNNDSGSGTGKNEGNSGDGTGNGGSNSGGGNGDATDADAQKKQKIADKITEISNSTDWKSFLKLVNDIVGDSELQVEDVFQKIKEKIGGKVYYGNTVLDFTIDDNAKLIEFLKFCYSVESVFKKNDDTLKFYFKAGDDVNIFIDTTTDNKFKLDGLESLVTIENTDPSKGLNLDADGKITLLDGTYEWDSGKDIDKIVEFLEGISKMNLGSNFKGLEVRAGGTENSGSFFIDQFVVKAFGVNNDIEKIIKWLTILGEARKNGTVGKYFENMEVVDNIDTENTEIKIFGCSVDFKNYFSNDVDVCQRFFAALYPDGLYSVKNNGGNAEIYRKNGDSEYKVGVLNAATTTGTSPSSSSSSSSSSKSDSNSSNNDVSSTGSENN